MHTKITDIAEGLVNGATGTIKQIEIPPSYPLKGTMYIHFHGNNTSKNLTLTSKYKGLVTVTAVSAVFSITDKSTYVQEERTQFPGTLAWGITIDKSQGSAYHEMIADMTFTKQQKTTMPGQIYTMLCRAKSIDAIKFNSFHISKILVNKSALEEMPHLGSDKMFT
ncbi:hypothetical protein DPMN_105415 [Dreissena polymorpha]|uniref:Uncharacterized protein n=1 Tax=Dreissena polymorpha TaxID=45954 RepID=A0A9D4HDS1_DREPO|nr:hypothetical protein DPMN_105415 [Dreissena polymorpha]